MKLTDEMRDVVINYLTEHPQSTALNVGKELNQHFPELPAVRKTGNQVLYRMEKEGTVTIAEHSGTKPLWDITNRKENDVVEGMGKMTITKKEEVEPKLPTEPPKKEMTGERRIPGL